MEAFNTLTDTILEEIDFLSGTVRGELWRLPCFVYFVISGLGLRVWGLGLRVWGLGFGVSDF